MSFALVNEPVCIFRVAALMEETPQHTIFTSLDLVKISWWIQIRMTYDTFTLKKK